MEHGHISRKEFLGMSAAAGLCCAPLLASCGGEKLPEVGKGQTIIEEDKLKPGSAFTFADAKSGEPRMLVRMENGEFSLLSAKCTHNGCTVGYKPEAGRLICPCHGSVFAFEDGAVIGGPAEDPLPKLKVKVVDGAVYSA